MSVSFESLAGASPSVSYGSLTASLPECTRFDTLDGAFLLRTSQRYEYLANQGIRTTLSFITVRSQTSNSSAANSAQNISATAPALQSSDHTTPTSPLPPSSAFTADAAVDTESHAPSDRTAVASIASATAAVSGGGGGDKFFGKMRRKTSFYIPNSSSGKGNSSSFVERIKTFESLALFLTSRPVETPYFFVNVGRQFIWADYTLQTRPALSCLILKDAFVTCHDVNPLTRENMDTVLGFSSGDIMIYSPISGKYVRKNKQLPMNKSAVTCIKWLPGSETLFMAGFGDGTVLILDRERDDHPTVAPVAIDSNTSFTVSKPLQKTASKVNPVSHWNLSKRPITSIQFSPDSVHVAITSLDGSLRVLDFAQDKLLDTCNSYFGGLLCCAWSPDGKFVATGGEDDLVTVWTFGGRIVARCQGHSSWVTGVAFDAYNCTERNYRIGSVSEDTKLCLWDFSSSSLYKPRSSRKSTYRPDHDKSTVHPVLPKKQVAMLEPFMAQSIHNEPLCFLAFREDAVVTADRVGAIKFWARPKVGEVDFEQQERGGGGMSHG